MTAKRPTTEAIVSKLLKCRVKRGSRDIARERPAIMYKKRIVI
jgi:hypothetical protein